MILVDGEDRALGEAGLLAAHRLPGKRHRAFTALLFDAGGERLLLARRAAGKLLWPGYWDWTVASHPRPGEDTVAAGERRLPEELGLAARLGNGGRFEYRAVFGSVGAEYEVCAALVGRLDGGARPRPDPGEVAELRWAGPGELLRELAGRPERYCPWLYLALLLLGRGGDGEALLPEPWRRAVPDAPLEEALRTHLADGDWRLAGGGPGNGPGS